MLSANFKPERTAAVLRGFLATARLSCVTQKSEITPLLGILTSQRYTAAQ